MKRPLEVEAEALAGRPPRGATLRRGGKPPGAPDSSPVDLATIASVPRSRLQVWVCSPTCKVPKSGETKLFVEPPPALAGRERGTRRARRRQGTSTRPRGSIAVDEDEGSAAISLPLGILR